MHVQVACVFVFYGFLAHLDITNEMYATLGDRDGFDGCTADTKRPEPLR